MNACLLFFFRRDDKRLFCLFDAKNRGFCVCRDTEEQEEGKNARRCRGRVSVDQSPAVPLSCASLVAGAEGGMRHRRMLRRIT